MSDTKFNPLSLVPFVGQAFDSYQQARTARKNTEMTIRHQKQEAELAYQRQQEMWHMQNAYNSPEEQMKRFGAAGLNPHLIYGQGSAGNAQGTPSYQPPNIQYKYAAPAYGTAVSSVLPTLMQVGSWLQNMRLTETEIDAKKSTLEKTEQLIGYLEQINPKKVKELDNKLSLYPYQRSMAYAQQEKAQTESSMLMDEYQHRFGDDRSRIGGLRGQEYLKAIAEARLKKVQADWFEPATIMKLVLGGVLGMAGLGRIGGRAASTGGRINQKVREIGKGQRGRWSQQGKRWIPSSRNDGSYKVRPIKYGYEYTW